MMTIVLPASTSRSSTSRSLAISCEMQAGGRFVEDIDGPAGGPLGQLLGQLDPLGFAAGKGGGRLTELDVAQADIVEGLELVLDPRDVFQELQRLGDGHVEDIGNALPLVVHFEGLPVVARALADLALDIDIRQKVHLDLDDAVAGAGFAAPALDVEGEAARLVAAQLRFRQWAKRSRMSAKTPV